jgi:hypothetical protein
LAYEVASLFRFHDSAEYRRPAWDEDKVALKDICSNSAVKFVVRFRGLAGDWINSANRYECTLTENDRAAKNLEVIGESVAPELAAA